MLQNIGFSFYEHFYVRQIIHFFLEVLLSTMISMPHLMYL